VARPLRGAGGGTRRRPVPAVGAVSLFALSAWLGGESTRAVHGLLMVPFQLAAVGAIWSLRTRWSPWFAAIVAFWPLNAWFWEYRFDLVPTALLVVGIALAWRQRWELAGAALALGTAVKWSPAVAVPALLAYLIVARRRRAALGLTLAFAVTLAAVHLPYLAWRPSEVLAAYSRQGGRSITDESLWHLPLRVLGLEGREGYAQPAFVSVDPPGWADDAAVALQLAVLLVFVLLAARSRTFAGALAVSALMPVVFLATNRVFSVQYLVLFLVAWAAAAALAARTGRDALAATFAALAATLANVLIVPYPTDVANLWEVMSALRFAIVLTLTAWLAWRAVRQREPGPAPPPHTGAGR
jgi:hypothetical protein